MKERPILFSAPMVRAILEGRKTQTRRALYVQTKNERYACFDQRYEPWSLPLPPLGKCWTLSKWRDATPGDRLWVRENWRTYASLDDIPPRAIAPGAGVQYEAGGSNVIGAERLHGMGKFRPGMFMPRWASRITLEITGVRVERLNDISEDDCWAEGIEQVMHDFDDVSQCVMAKRIGASIDDAKPLYAKLWESINSPGSWDKNPWVWCISFRRIDAS